jgi:hypothetical protein
MVKDSSPQPDLFDDDFDAPRAFRCIGGAFIGTFNRQAVALEAADGAGKGADPIRRLSTFLPSEAAAQAALAAGTWPPAEPEEP